jgi:hypothetical protein
MPRNRLPRVTKHYSPTDRRNDGRPLKRLLDAWDQNGSTRGPTPWQIYDDFCEIIVHLLILKKNKKNKNLLLYCSSIFFRIQIK